MDLGEMVAELLDGRGDGRGSVDDDTVFAAASLSKPVFASGVMSLVDASRWSWTGR